jgi:hypothetical protein
MTLVTGCQARHDPSSSIVWARETALTASEHAGADTTVHCPELTGRALAQPLQCARRETLDYNPWLRSLSQQGTK